MTTEQYQRLLPALPLLKGWPASRCLPRGCHDKVMLMAEVCQEVRGRAVNTGCDACVAEMMNDLNRFVTEYEKTMPQYGGC